MQKRTDLAAEARQLWQESAGETTKLPGVQARDYKVHGVAVTEVTILDRRGAQALGKPEGSYFTLDFAAIRDQADRGIRRATETLGKLLQKMLALEPRQSVLVIGLGNPAVTPDAIGPEALQHLLIPRHLVEQLPVQFGHFRPVSALSPGVLGTTGLESAEVVRGAVAYARPTAVVVIDALAARDPARLCSTVQLADSGIVPGSGVGNSRAAFTRQTLGVPVVAVGIPTVVDAGTLAMDLLERNGYSLPKDPLPRGMMVTPGDIDAGIKRMARIVGCGISLALHPELSLEEIQGFIC